MSITKITVKRTIARLIISGCAFAFISLSAAADFQSTMAEINLPKAIQSGNLRDVKKHMKLVKDINKVGLFKKRFIDAQFSNCLLSKYCGMDVLNYLYEKGANTNHIDPTTKLEPFHYAVSMMISEHNMRKMGKKMPNFMPVDANAKEISTAEKMQRIQFLIQKGANVNAVNHIGDNLLFSAVIAEDFETAKLLIDAGTHIDSALKSMEKAYATNNEALNLLKQYVQ